MTKPVPDCSLTGEVLADLGCFRRKGTRSARRRRPLLRVVASMLTTAGLMLSATSAKFTIPGAIAARDATAGVATVASTTCGSS